MMSKKALTQPFRLIAIVGPTASGKSDLGVNLAKKFNGEVVSVDSRQVYRGLDVGTGKITKREMRGVPHHLLDVADPKKTFTAAAYAGKAQDAIADIIARGKVPFLVGGSGFYLAAALGRISLPDVPPNRELRERLGKKSTRALAALLARRDPRRAAGIDRFNRVRLIRALEIIHALGAVPMPAVKEAYDVLEIGIETDSDTLKGNIDRRLRARMPGMTREAKRLHTRGLSWKRMRELGLEYRFLAAFLQKEMTKEEMVEHLAAAIWRYAKRQKTWLKRNRNIRWLPLSQERYMERLVADFLKKK